jgi:hypothetical protein
MSDNEILKKQRAGFYRDIELPTKQPEQSDLKQKLDEIEGVKPTGEAEYQHNVLEMHVDLDISEFESFGGEKSKNIKVPYIVTIDEGSQEILSIYRNYDPEDELQRRIEYFVHYKFLPGLGFYGFGLIHMIGGLSRTATSALRQLLDAGTLANLPAGFKSRGIRIRDDDQPFQPGEFRDVDAPGGNIKDQFQILPFKEPSQTLFQLLGFVVQAGQRFASIADMQLGEDTANRAVGTTIALLERGSRVMSAIHKRIYYTMKQEFRLLSDVFGTYLPPIYPYAVYGADRMVKGADFDDRVDVIPVADPNIFSMAQRFTLAQTQLQIAQSNPQIHDLREAYRRVYESMGTRQIDLLMPPEQPPVPQDPAVENAKALQTQPLQVFPDQDHDAHIAAHATFIQSRMVQINPIVYALLQGHISDHISQKAQSDVAALVSQSEQLAMLAEQDPAGFQTQFNSLVAKKIVELTVQLIQAEGGTQKEDPLIALKQRELDLKAMDIQRRAQENAADMDRKMSEFEDTSDLERLRLETQDQQSTDRLKIAKEKLALQAKAQQDKANAIKKG